MVVAHVFGAKGINDFVRTELLCPQRRGIAETSRN
jgi:hypothetical protein